MSTQVLRQIAPIYDRPEEILANLIRFDTRNPPGNEAECIGYLNNLLTEAGLEPRILAREIARPNLLCRIQGQGSAPPFLMYGHADVVPVTGQAWQVPPFEGRIQDGYIWGRGAFDMKGALAMMVAALLKAKAEGLSLPGDVILAVLSDEEAGSEFGAKYLVENHPEEFQGVRYGIGEFGGASMEMLGKRFYPVMVSEKHMCWMKATVRGPAGHAALHTHGGTMSRVAAFLAGLDRNALPVHVTSAAAHMVKAIAKALPFPMGSLASLMLWPSLTGLLLKALGPKGNLFVPLFHNTVNATIVRGGDKMNVVPSEVEIALDGRLLPGFSFKDVAAELRSATGVDVELELLREEPDQPEPDMSLFDTIAGVLKECDPEAVPMPMLLSAVTDGRWFSRLGIQTYGFTPMRLPPDLNFASLIHASDERIPVDALGFGRDAICKLLGRFATR